MWDFMARGLLADITAEPIEKEARTVAEVIEDIWQNRDRNYSVRCLGMVLRLDALTWIIHDRT
jgi:hypothetical protein